MVTLGHGAWPHDAAADTAGPAAMVRNLWRPHPDTDNTAEAPLSLPSLRTTRDVRTAKAAVSALPGRFGEHCGRAA